MYYVYILYSSKSQNFYYGYTTDLKKRIEEHNNGFSISTKPYIPWKLVWYCCFSEQKIAKDFERYIKSGSGKAFAYKHLLNVALMKDGKVQKKGVPKL